MSRHYRDCTCDAGRIDKYVVNEVNLYTKQLYCEECNWEELCSSCMENEIETDKATCEECEFERSIAAADAAMDAWKEGY